MVERVAAQAERLDVPMPSDLLRVQDSMYLHAIVNRGFPNVVWTEIWKSDDNGVSWRHMGDKAKFPPDMHRGHAQCWSWDYDPEHEWVYVVSTSLKRANGIILKRVRPEDIGDIDEYDGWGYADGRWAWGNEPTPITPDGETWGELCLRRFGQSKWILGREHACHADSNAGDRLRLGRRGPRE